ncbi:MAG: 30S ribosomal protein S12 methylthiotransferase RimO [Actinobacteria bacterium]|nr:30S ribosomal protein S12 methylthiotransferase RimO [Actinomycetota bacterium]
MSDNNKVAVVTLGCARNEVDSEEMAGRLAANGWELVDDPAQADAVLVNTCGFVEVAKKDSIDAILAAADLKSIEGGPQTVVAVGCLAERYGNELAESLPEADAVLGFDDYPDIGETLRRIVAGEAHVPHVPTDRRQLLPISPVDRQAAAGQVPGHGTHASESDAVPGWQPPVLRRRLDGSPVAPVKLASGCDRRCTFCAIPSFRGSFVSRPPLDVVSEIAWLVGEGVREVVLVSENSTSYGKDLGDLRLLEALLPRIAADTSIGRVRVAYLQPAEVRPDLLRAIATVPVVAPYYDLSFQHASPTVLRRMRRFGGRAEFGDLIDRIRALDPAAGIRSNVIVGFPGETEEEFGELLAFLEEARLDAVGVFGYSDEDGTEAATLPDKIDVDVVRARVEIVTALVDEVMSQRAEDRIGERVVVLVEALEFDDDDAPVAVGRAGHQGPDDAGTTVRLGGGASVAVGDLIHADVVDAVGVDLLADLVETEA